MCTFCWKKCLKMKGLLKVELVFTIFSQYKNANGANLIFEYAIRTWLCVHANRLRTALCQTPVDLFKKMSDVFVAVSCSDDSDCTVGGDACIVGYCQPENCTATAQCVADNYCSEDTVRRCVGLCFIKLLSYRIHRIKRSDIVLFKKLK